MLWLGTLGLRLVLLAFLLAAIQARAAITFVGSSTAAASSGSIVLNKPAGTVTNDVLVVVIVAKQVSKAGARTITPPVMVPTWTSKVLTDAGNSVMRQQIFVRPVQASDGASYTFTTSYADHYSAALLVYRGVVHAAITDPGLGVGQVNTPASTSMVAPSISPSVAQTMLVGAFSADTGNGSSTPPGGMTERTDAASGAGPNGVALETADELRTVSGPTGTRIATHSGSEVSIGQHIALNPARTFLVEAAGGGSIGTQVAGTSFNIRITARNPNGTTDTTFTGTVDLTTTGTFSTIAPTINTTTASFVAGVLTSHTLRYQNAGTFNITATQTGGTNFGVSTDFVVAPRLQILVPGETASPGCGGTGKTGSPSTQTTAIAFNVTVNAVDECWNVVTSATDVVTLTSTEGGATLPAPTALSSGSTTLSVTFNNPGAFSITASASAPARSDTSSLVTAQGAGRFNACDVGATCTNTTPTTYIRTKVAGTNFNLQLIALTSGGVIDTSYNSTVLVELLDSSDNTGALDSGSSCRSTWTTVIATLAPNPAFVPADNGVLPSVGPFNVANSYRDVRVRVTNVGGATRQGCSTDAFAIRPSTYDTVSVTDTDWQTSGTGGGGDRTLGNTGATGGVVHKAGRPFRISMRAVNSAGAATTNYNGATTGPSSAVPTALLLPTGCAGCTTGTLATGSWTGTGTVVTTAATYSEVGALTVRLEDRTFADVDSGDAGSTTAERYVVSPVFSVGRFVPEQLTLASSQTPQFRTFNVANGACSGSAPAPIRSFTYIGQGFGYLTAPQLTLTAERFGGGTTLNYSGNLFKVVAGNVTQTYSNNGTGPSLDTAAVSTPSVTGNTTATGTGTVDFGGTLGYVRGTPIAPFTSNISLQANLSDPSENAVTGNGTIGTAGAVTFNGGGTGIAFDGGGASSGKEFRYGRMRLQNGTAPLNITLPLQISTQYWTGSAWSTNTADHCTLLNAKNVVLSGQVHGLTGANMVTPTGGSDGNVVAGGAFLSGVGSLRLSRPSPTPALPGRVTVCVDLDSGAGGDTTCQAVTPANAVYLQGDWDGNGSYNNDPSATASFGVFGAQPRNHIFFRENF
ncbi:MAG TPA: DUF6701 domain-containing protein [Burkholderiales bacterium]